MRLQLMTAVVFNDHDISQMSRQVRRRKTKRLMVWLSLTGLCGLMTAIQIIFGAGPVKSLVLFLAIVVLATALYNDQAEVNLAAIVEHVRQHQQHINQMICSWNNYAKRFNDHYDQIEPELTERLSEFQAALLAQYYLMLVQFQADILSEASGLHQFILKVRGNFLGLLPTS